MGTVIPYGVVIGIPPRFKDPDEHSLRICDVCKRLLDRREEAMDLRTAHSVFVDVYQKLCSLLTQIANLAPSYRNMAESLKWVCDILRFLSTNCK